MQCPKCCEKFEDPSMICHDCLTKMQEEINMLKNGIHTILNIICSCNDIPNRQKYFLKKKCKSLLE